MVSIRRKNIKGRQYLYAEHSFRLPGGKIKKVSKLIHRKEDAASREVLGYFLKEEVSAHSQETMKKHLPNHILTKEQLQKAEEYRVEYKHLLSKLTKKQLQDVIDRFTVNFTYESNALEGNSLTLKDVTFILTENRLPQNKDLREVYETRNMRQAAQLLFDKKVRMTKENILKLHRMTVQDTGVAGGFKKFPNFLLMRRVQTTPPERVDEEMTKLIEWYERAHDHPLKVAADFHARFEQTHPFEDGNGRVGRLLLNAILLEHGYPPIIIRKTARASYLACLEAYDNGHKDKLYRFTLKKFKQTFENFFRIYVKYI